MRRIFTLLILSISFGAVILFFSRIKLNFDTSQVSLLTLAIRYVSESEELCRKASEEEKLKMLPHMRRDEICERERKKSLVHLVVDGNELYVKQLQPLGFRSDGLSVLLHTIPMLTGEHRVEISLKSIQGEAISTFSENIFFENNRRYLVDYQKGKGFELY